MSKHITLCADDYSFTVPVSQAIIQLIQRQRLSATSCMTNTPHWPAHAAWLHPYINQIDIGLHLNVTDGQALSAEYKQCIGDQLPTLTQLMMTVYLRRYDQAAFVAEFQHQLDRFVAHMNRAPDFIDGHQHVHQLPVLRDALITLYEKNPSLKNTYVRIPSNGLADYFIPKRHGLKSAVITATGSLALRKQLDKQRIAYNHSFSGVYNFKQAAHYRHYFCRFLTQIKSGGLIMCHPGLKADKAADTIAHSRWQEYFYLQSNEFQEDCCQKNVTIGRWLNCHK